MPGVSYDLLLGKDFFAATRAKIGMEEDSARATLTWNGIQQTFNLTDDFGEYGLIGEVKGDEKEYEMEEIGEKLINTQVSNSRCQGIWGHCAYKIVSTWQS